MIYRDRTLLKAYRNKGIALFNLQMYDESIECYDKALALEPDDCKTLINKGITLDESGKHHEAIKIYDEVISKLEPEEEDIQNIELDLQEL